MQTNEFPIVPIKKESERFNKFLSLSENHRIIFTGVFGSGKTYFLREFFKDNKGFLSLHLFPVNYSVSSNEDIFEYIKYDILFELLGYKVYLNDDKLSSLNALTFIAPDDYSNIVKDFVSLIPKIGKPVVGVIEPLIKFKEIIEEKKRDLSTNEGQLIKDFAESLHSKKGSLYENDFYTKLITELIKRLKVETGGKEIVLIIDDLDRIDPDHIFRILNVLAVHFKNDKINEYENKFDIDKIVLCCDVANVRSIFRTRFGQEADFNGYIDKFYSKEIYSFNNGEFVKEIVSDIVSTVTSNNRNFYNLSWGYLNFFIEAMVKSGALSIRTLKRLHYAHYEGHLNSIRIAGHNVNPNMLKMFGVFDFLFFIFGDADGMIRAISNTRFPYNEYTEELAIELLLIADFNNHQFLENYPVSYDGLQYQIKKDGFFVLQMINDEAGFRRLSFSAIGEFEKLLANASKSFITLRTLVSRGLN